METGWRVFILERGDLSSLWIIGIQRCNTDRDPGVAGVLVESFAQQRRNNDRVGNPRRGLDGKN
jgi:hypothetical protein